MTSIAHERPLLIGCGVLQRELCRLIAELSLPIDTLFLDAALHIDMAGLASAIKVSLAANRHRRVILFYGCCHPAMEEMVAAGNATRTHGENCVEMLLGRDACRARLEDGAFFLLEAWAGTFATNVAKSFGTSDPNIIQSIFAGDRKFLQAIRTPCSTDFTADAERASQLVGLPVQWMETSLDHLETVLREAIDRQLQGAT